MKSFLLASLGLLFSVGTMTNAFTLVGGIHRRSSSSVHQLHSSNDNNDDSDDNDENNNNNNSGPELTNENKSGVYRGDSDTFDSNQWISQEASSGGSWEANLQAQESGQLWSSFEPSSTSDIDESTVEGTDTSDRYLTEEEEQAAYLNIMAELSATESEFNQKEAEVAEKARQMAEWGFSNKAITNTFDVATDGSFEEKQVDGMQEYQKEAYTEDMFVDLETVESHTTVDMDPDTGDPVRAQMVYVDEVSCIGCTNCAMIADNTFLMESDYGRARVFSQWGDDDETIAIAIETCPVDCIHYVPYPELEALEIERRGQNINFKARLVGQSVELADKVGASVRFTGQQKISGNMKPRCNNCPSRGCKDCPMFGVGKNPEFEKRELMRKEKAAKRRLEKERKDQQKSVDL